MMRISWSPYAAKTLLGLTTADQRRVVDAVTGFGRSLERAGPGTQGQEPNRLSVGGYNIHIQNAMDGLEVREISLAGVRR